MKPDGSFKPTLLRNAADSVLEVSMDFCKRAVGVLLLMSAATAVASERAAPKPDWLVGNWVLCEDPDHSPRDTLQFNADGTGLVIRAKGSTEFRHRHSERAVSLLANANGYAIPIELSSSSGFDKLFLYSKRTGSTSTYVRSDGAHADTCSIK
ncbi:hypothetical protein ACQQ2N_03205 [Dokdonella sp. MW10]|uniref:hypothetical protein n=1 Tax=Dokdonella sp. MW10 TaxID=2992926 RepID=UPI003F7D63C4